MGKILQNFWKRQGIGKRMFSLVMVFAMVVTLLQTMPGSLMTAQAAEGDMNVTLHFFNEYNWTTPAIQYWGGTSTMVSGYTGEPTQIVNWNDGDIGYVMNQDGEDWYSVTLKGNFEGFQFLDLELNDKGQHYNTAGKGFVAEMKQFTGDTAIDLYCEFSEKTNHDCIWYTDADRQVPLKAPETTEPTPGEGEDDNQGGSDSSDVAPSDRIQLQIGDNIYDMYLFMNGVYEIKVTLGEGTYTTAILKNGTATTLSNEFSVPEGGAEVCFRLQNGELKNSINDRLVHTTTLVGGFDGLNFLKEENGESYTIGWTPENSAGNLNYYGGGIYGRTFHFTETETDKNYEYKITFDGTWDGSLGDGGGNYSLTIPAGATSVTFFVDQINGKVYNDIVTPDFEVVQSDGNNLTKNAFTTSVSLIGTVRGENDWSADARGFEFTQISDTLYRYQKTFATGNYVYKCVFDYEKWYEAEAGDRNLTISEDNTNVVIIYNTADGKLYDSINNEQTVAELLGMKAAPAEPATSAVTTNANGSTTFQMVTEAGKNLKLHYALLPAEGSESAPEFKETAMTETGSGVYVVNGLFFGDDAVNLVYYYDVDGTFTLDDASEKMTVAGVEYSNYKREIFTGRLVNVPGTFPGAGSWDEKTNAMTYQGNGLYAHTFKDVPAANYEFKIAFGTWLENYGVDGVPGGDNYSVTVPETQDVTVFYNDFSHRAVTSLNYVFADVALSGKNIPEGTKLTDSGLTGIYSATIAMPADTYEDVKITYNEKEYPFGTFILEEAKNVTFYFDPTSEIYYNDASNLAINETAIFYDSRYEKNKSVYGAVATGEEVTFSIQTGLDIATVSLVIKGMEPQTINMEKDTVASSDTATIWSATTSFSKIGENNYYFVISNGSSVKVYADDDGYYGTGMVTDLTSIKPYDLVVYKSGYETPDWMKNAVVYQIFPDRFYDGDSSNNQAQTTARGEVDYEYVEDWYTLPENPEQEALLSEEAYKATGAFYGDRNWSNEIYGGDLEGITDQIEYLKALGVTVIYINPVFSSISSHRYDTSDYTIIDPILGDLGDFQELVAAADANNMHIVLDGVFNHVSDDSIYFDRYYKYLEDGVTSIGAYPYWAYVYDYMSDENVNQAAAEDAAKTYFSENYGITDYSYTTWFDIYAGSYLKDDSNTNVVDNIGLRAGKPVYGYDGWWGYDSMPVIKSTNGSEYQTGDWAEEIIYNEDNSSVTQYWLEQGSDGWRLDVANEVSDETWQNFRDSVKALSSDNVIIGEIWDDATEYLLGDMYDSVMNYMFRNAVTAFAMGGNSIESVYTLEKLRERYPQEAFYAMMNLVSSHDTTRILSYLDGIGDDRNQKDVNSAFPTYENTSDLAKQRQYLVAFLQFTYAGAPTIYYGDEIGMVGADDPDDRRGFTWGKGNKELVTWYATLGNIRNQYEALRTGSVEAFNVSNEKGAVNMNMMAFVRRDENDTMVVLANNSQSEQIVTIDLAEINVTAEQLTDLISDVAYTVSDGKVEVTVPALSGAILADHAKAITVNEEALKPAYDPAYVVTKTTGDDDNNPGGGTGSNPGDSNPGSGSESGSGSGSGSSSGHSNIISTIQNIVEVVRERVVEVVQDIFNWITGRNNRSSRNTAVAIAGAVDETDAVAEAVVEEPEEETEEVVSEESSSNDAVSGDSDDNVNLSDEEVPLADGAVTDSVNVIPYIVVIMLILAAGGAVVVIGKKKNFHFGK